MATWIVFAGLTGEWIKAVSKTEAYQRFQQARELAKETSKIWLKEGIKEVQDTKQMMEQQPEWTEFRTEGWTKFAEVTSDGVKTTPYWTLRILQKLGWKQVNWRIRWFQWAREQLRDKNKLITRDSNAPVWEPPVVKTPDTKNNKNPKSPEEKVKIKEDEITPERQEEINQKWFYTDQKPIVKGDTTNNWNTSIWEYIKQISNSKTGPNSRIRRIYF
jgi:hypothetical protein